MIEQALSFDALLYFLNASYYVLNCQVFSQDIHSANPLLTFESFNPYSFLVIRELFLVFIVDGPGKSVRLFEFRLSVLYIFWRLSALVYGLSGCERTSTWFFLVSCECPTYQLDQSFCYLVLRWLQNILGLKYLIGYFWGSVLLLFLPRVYCYFELF